ncbi:SDR family NAD(P)-dependent oxidoreductase [Pseudomonas sp. 13B_2.1_Bac1]|uniref:SDR family NAD(P)-dependent oxidoreductase n=1 Tax=Pseudomonas sp. 13B_2.1_Bac1 TaxID=2971624 RepID=UPI0021C677F6|nr:SDR family NAD(P)-dependent oxidoreductase [Pseudomonas sp. 13B_2.1_Bac1]MCU1785201.1 SDR family NAD(P)-dependent oxidoreductase [Pseudomonas sp. 13B_2.1_Bac1]
MTQQWLEGKVAIVTGGGRGLGRAHALALAEAGARVLVNDLGGSDRGGGASEAPAHDVVKEIRAAGGQAEANTSSVSDWDSARSVVEDAIRHFGRLDIVVNNAGISRFGTDIATITKEDWEITLAVNLTGTAAVSHWAAAYWHELGPESGRAIINTSSPAGVNPMPGSPAYCVSKAAVAALTQSSAAELARLGVRVNALAPMARTRMTDAVPIVDAMMPRTETFDPYAPGNVAPLVVYLASSDCRFTGRVFGIGGGRTYLFSGWSATEEILVADDNLSVAGIAAALQQVPISERPQIIMPGARLEKPFPDEDILQALSQA